MRKAADTGKSVHLSASAGSGKTRALKDRYLALLDVLDNRGLNIDQAVAITFTDKAAAEIKERVMHDLPESMLKKIIRDRQDLRISTIHSFCMNLLKRYPLEAGLPPDFGVLDARDQTYKIQKAIEDALEESDRDQAIMAPLRDFTADDLIATIEFLLSIRSRIKRMEIDAGGPEKLLRSVRSGMGVEQADTELRGLTTSTTWRTNLQKMEQGLKSQGDYYDECMAKEHIRLAEANDVDSVLRISGSLVSIYFNKDGSPSKKAYITKSKYHGKNRDDYEKVFFDIQAMLGQLRSLHARVRAGREAVSLLKLSRRAEEKYQNSKLREGLLDFDDLEIYAYRLLQGMESTDILYWLDRKILHFLVDEFQDTSDIQWAILNKLTEEIFAGQGADKRMPPTLFVVGDEKQSIYRFREANYRLIENVKQKMEKNLPPESREILTLDKNFRSTPEVIETVNRVFATLWGEAYKPSDVERTEHNGSIRLIELTQPPSDESPSGPTEAEVLAREIKSLIAGGTMIYEKAANTNPPPSPFPKGGSKEIPPITKGGTGGLKSKTGTGWQERKANYGDCAVLIQSRTKLKEYEAALQAESIPYRVIGGIGFYDEDEIQALMNVLFFLWNRDDKLALAAALKSPLFSLTDKDLFDLMQNNRNMVDALKLHRPDDWRLLHEWMSIAGLVPLSNLIQRIVNETGAYVRFGRKNPQAIFNIDKLLDTAREFDRRGYTTLQDFVEWVKNIRQTEQREATADMNLPGFQGSVSVLTVHKAKGLEYPVVFLPGMNQQLKSLSTGPLAIVEDSNNGARMAVKDAKSPVYDELWEREHEEILREHQRLLYVAMTRARDHLVMLGTLNDGKTPIKPNTWLDYLHRTIPMFKATGDDGRARIINYAYPEWQAQVINSELPALPRSPQQKEKPIHEIDVEAVLENLSPVLRSETPEWKKATDFIHQEKEESIEKLFLQGETRAVSPLTRGSVLHRCLEEFTKIGAYDLNRVIMEYPDILTLSDDVKHQFIDDVSSVLTAVLGKSDLSWIFERRPWSYSELPFLYKKGHVLISGIMDRVVIKEGKGFVIDYKAILVENDETLASWKDHYRPQIQIYCEAVKEMFGLQDVEGSLLFLDSSRLAPCSRA
jgi:ATP-dependent helicase/nuclease subunit A